MVKSGDHEGILRLRLCCAQNDRLMDLLRDMGFIGLAKIVSRFMYIFVARRNVYISYW